MKAYFSTRIPGILTAMLLGLVVSFPAFAHHSAAPFDMSKQITVQGTVEKWVWTNPHTWLYLRVENADGTEEIWGLEAGGPGMLSRQGWNSHDMKSGDKVTVKAAPSRDGRPIGLINEIVLSTGRVLSAGAGTPPPGFGVPDAPPSR